MARLLYTWTHVALDMFIRVYNGVARLLTLVRDKRSRGAEGKDYEEALWSANPDSDAYNRKIAKWDTPKAALCLPAQQ